jgi:hypothetical protein
MQSRLCLSVFGLMPSGLRGRMPLSHALAHTPSASPSPALRPPSRVALHLSLGWHHRATQRGGGLGLRRRRLSAPWLGVVFCCTAWAGPSLRAHLSLAAQPRRRCCAASAGARFLPFPRAMPILRLGPRGRLPNQPRQRTAQHSAAQRSAAQHSTAPRAGARSGGGWSGRCPRAR